MDEELSIKEVRERYRDHKSSCLASGKQPLGYCNFVKRFGYLGFKPEVKHIVKYDSEKTKIEIQKIMSLGKNVS